MSMLYEPEDDENTLTIRTTNFELSFEELWQKIIEKWPNARLRELSFRAINEQTSGCGCCKPDYYDYDQYIQITRNKE